MRKTPPLRRADPSVTREKPFPGAAGKSGARQSKGGCNRLDSLTISPYTTIVNQIPTVYSNYLGFVQIFGGLFVYNGEDTARRIKMRAKERGVVFKNMLTELDMGINLISRLKNGQNITAVNLAKIADYLDCSVDYLLGRTNDPEIAGSLCQLTPEEFAKVQVFAQGLLAARQIDASPKSNFLNHKEP